MELGAASPWLPPQTWSWLAAPVPACLRSCLHPGARIWVGAAGAWFICVLWVEGIHSFWPFAVRRNEQPGKGGSLGLCLPEIHVLVSSFQMRVRFSLVSAVFCLSSFRLPAGSPRFHTFLHCGESFTSNLGMFWSQNIWLIPVDLGAVSILQAAECLLHPFSKYSVSLPSPRGNHFHPSCLL